MKLKFHAGRVTLVVSPVDMRSGFNRLAGLCRDLLGINVLEGNDYVVFVSKTCVMAKIIFADEQGSVLITRRLHQAHYQQLLMQASGPATQRLTIRDLERYLDGEPLQVRRQNLLKN